MSAISIFFFIAVNHDGTILINYFLSQRQVENWQDKTINY